MKSSRPLPRLVRATKNTVDGIKALWKYEQAFRLEVLMLLTASPVILMLPIAAIFKLVLILLLFLIFVLEAINSAIETIVDQISTDFNESSRIAKDLGSAAVGLTLLMNLIAWVYVVFFLII